MQWTSTMWLLDFQHSSVTAVPLIPAKVINAISNQNALALGATNIPSYSTEVVGD